MNKQQLPKKFNILVSRINPQQVVAEAHGQKITLSTKGDDPSLGFTAPEAVLVAFGSCVLMNLAKGAAEMGLEIQDSSVEFDAVKRSNPLGFEDIHFTLHIKSPEPKEKLQALYKKATTNGTAANALLEGLKPQGNLYIQSSSYEKTNPVRTF
jgi:uncharacterized OsmC-like protein